MYTKKINNHDKNVCMNVRPKFSRFFTLSIQSKMSLIANKFQKDVKYKAIIEKVISGDRVVSHIFLDDGSEQELVTLIAGIRTPRSTDAKTGAEGEPFGDEAKKYTETRLLNQKVWVKFIGVSSNDVPVIIIFHPAGNISEKIISSGLAYVSDWQVSLIGPQGISSLRSLEKKAKLAGKGLWKSFAQEIAKSNSSSSTFKIGSTIEGTVSRIISTDSYNILLSNGTEQLVHLTSLRSPRSTDPKSAPFIPQSKEFVRKYIGKKIKITTEAFRNETPLVSITLPNGKNLSELIVLNGFATVIRHRSTDTDRSDIWDKLIENEEKSIKDKRGLHSNKVPEPEKYIEASTDSGRAKIHLRTLINKSKIQGIVEYVISPNRVRVVLPRENIRLTLVFAGLLSVQKDSPISEKILEFNNLHILQRDVTVEIFDVDKVGGFISNLYLNSNLPYQIELIKNGFAEVHGGSVRKTKFEDQFYDAEEDAQDKRLGIWVNWDPEEEEKKYQAEEEKRQAKWEAKHAKDRKPNAFDFDDDEEEDLSNLPESVRKLVIKR